MTLIRSKQRVADHGEVFTPPWMVEAMLKLVEGETERIDARFLEPACGSGNFLVPVLRRKLAAVELKFGRTDTDFDRHQYALLGLMCTYGIELLADNIEECRDMLEVLTDYLGLSPQDSLYRAASHVLAANLVHGDALTMKTTRGVTSSPSPSGAIWARADFSGVISAWTPSRGPPRSVPKGRCSRVSAATKFSRPPKPIPRQPSKNLPESPWSDGPVRSKTL